MNKMIFKTFLPLLAVALLETVVNSCKKEEPKKDRHFSVRHCVYRLFEEHRLGRQRISCSRYRECSLL